MSKNGTRQNECMELDRILEAMKRIMAENSRDGSWNADWNSSSARHFLVIESRKTEHQLVATHRKEKMSKLGKRFKSRVMYHARIHFPSK
jgi:hypothetical protein